MLLFRKRSHLTLKVILIRHRKRWICWNQVQEELDCIFNNLSVDGMVHFNLQPDMALSNQARRKERLSPAHYAKGGLISEPTFSGLREESRKWHSS